MSPDDGKDGPVMSQALSSGVSGGGGLRDGYLCGGVLLGCPCIMEGWAGLGKADVGMVGPQNCSASALEQGWWQLDMA